MSTNAETEKYVLQGKSQNVQLMDLSLQFGFVQAATWVDFWLA